MYILFNNDFKSILKVICLNFFIYDDSYEYRLKMVYFPLYWNYVNAY